MQRLTDSTFKSFIKFSEAKKLFIDKQTLSAAEAINRIKEECGIDDIDALCVVRQLVDAGEMEEKIGATIREYFLHKNESRASSATEYEKTRLALLAAYESKPYWKVDSAVRTVLLNEQRELLLSVSEKNDDGNKNYDDPHPLRGRRRWKKKKKGVELQN